MRQTINSALKDAMKAKNQNRVSTLRLINAALKDRDIAARVSTDNGMVSDAEIMQILAKMIKQRQDSVTAYEEAGRLDLAEKEQQEIDIIQEFLPRALSPEEVGKAIDAAIESTGASSIRDMGKVMAHLKSAFAGQIDFAKAGAAVKARLSS